MAERTPQIKTFSGRDREALASMDLDFGQINLTEVAYCKDPDKLFVPGTYDEDLKSKQRAVLAYNRGFRSKAGIRTVEVFWGHTEELWSLIRNTSDLRASLEEKWLVTLDTSTHLSYQSSEALMYDKIRDEWVRTDWCECCGFMSGAVLLTVRPTRSHKSQH